MGKGDKKTRRGKIIKGSYGVLRRKKKKGLMPDATAKTKKKKTSPKAASPEKPAKKTASKAVKEAEKKTEPVESKVADEVIEEKSTDAVIVAEDETGEPEVDNPEENITASSEDKPDK